MSRRIAASILAAATVLLAGCGGSGTSGSEVTPTPTVTPVPTVTSPSVAPSSASPSRPAPLGPMTPTGRPTQTTPPSPVASIGATCLKPADAARKVTFRVGSGASITGAILGHGRAGVLLAHQSDGDLCQWLPYARDLAKAGHLVLDLELEGGRGSAGYVQYGGDQPVPIGLDVAGGVRLLRQQGARKVVLVGASMGGSAVLVGAAITRPVVNGVVSLSASPEYAGMDARTAATRLTVPVLYAATTEDMDYTGTKHYADVARDFYARTRSAKALTIVAGAAHGVAMIQEPGIPAVRRALDTFVAAHARG